MKPLSGTGGGAVASAGMAVAGGVLAGLEGGTVAAWPAAGVVWMGLMGASWKAGNWSWGTWPVGKLCGEPEKKLPAAKKPQGARLLSRCAERRWLRGRREKPEAGSRVCRFTGAAGEGADGSEALGPGRGGHLQADATRLLAGGGQQESALHGALALRVDDVAYARGPAQGVRNRRWGACMGAAGQGGPNNQIRQGSHRGPSCNMHG